MTHLGTGHFLAESTDTLSGVDSSNTECRTIGAMGCKCESLSRESRARCGQDATGVWLEVAEILNTQKKKAKGRRKETLARILGEMGVQEGSFCTSRMGCLDSCSRLLFRPVCILLSDGEQREEEGRFDKK